MADPGLTAAGLDADGALRAWLDHLAHERRLSPRTLEAYGHIGRLYLAFLQRHRGGDELRAADLTTITPAELRAHLAERRGGEAALSARSLAQTLAAIRGFHGFLDRRLDLPNPRLALVRGPRVCRPCQGRSAPTRRWACWPSRRRTRTPTLGRRRATPPFWR